MILNYIWVAFFLIAFVVGLIRLIFFGDMEVFGKIVDGTFSSARTAFDISLGLTGALTLWMGLMKIGEEAGAIKFLSRIIGPFFRRLFPEIPKDHPALGQIMLNFSANMLGLGNAATPLGLKAMQSMQELNPEKERASNSQIMFLVLNTAGFTLIPVSIMAIRAQNQALENLPINPTDVFIPILICTYCATIVGIMAVALWQKILDGVMLAGIAIVTAILAGLVYLLHALPPDQTMKAVQLTGYLLIFSIMVAFIGAGAYKKINVFSAFIEGAKEGFSTVIKIIPYLVAMLVGISVFRACGAMDFLISGISQAVAAVGLNTDFIPTLPIAFMKPLSGGGTQGLTVEAIQHYHVNSFVGKLSSIMYASADTTFYIVALYFGSVGIKKTRYAITGGLIADLAGVIAAILIAYLFFH
jgi:spore maturation protein SpmA/spore maturation protein SpmB